ncbi:MAG: hypothetical protein H0W36_11195 [Gemmatimonadetes bacterium]|nr:hypothetical protein [Gemmatimonadota bacterium]
MDPLRQAIYTVSVRHDWATEDNEDRVRPEGRRMTFLGREPTAIAAFLSIVINLAITFGLRLTVDQVALLNALVVAGLALLVRQNVTPTAAPKLALGTPVLVEGTGDQPPPDAVVAVR